ncbi:putative reverse transcriptase and RNase H [Colletotrichum sublineola]|nr:putative reverse transcriptase and RNase H [Colletotrichum sublineola]
MVQQVEHQNPQDMPPFGWHFGSTDAAQHLFCFPPPPSYFPPFFDCYGDQQRGAVYTYESPPDVSDSTSLQCLGNLSLRCVEEGDEEEDHAQGLVLDSPSSNYPVLCEEDQFIVDARAQRRRWGEIQRDYKAHFGASRSSTPQALAMRLSRLRQKHPKLKSVLGDKPRKKRRRRDQWSQGIQGSSQGDAIAAAQTLLDFLGQPDNGELVSQADCIAVVRIASQLRKNKAICQ